MNQDLTKGTPSAVIWRLCLPLFFGALVQQLYVVMDSLVAGRFIGETALAAIGNTYQITLLYQAIAFGVATGVSVVVSRRFGAGKGEEIRTATTTALITISLLCAVLTLVGLACCDALLKLIRTPENVFLPSRQYLQLYTIGLLPLFFYQIALGIFAALGDAKTPAIFLTISSLANIALDFLLVVRFQLGVSGIAWATLVCQAGSSAVSLMLLKNACIPYNIIT
jgi:Na+-driven multidrug efflux pump